MWTLNYSLDDWEHVNDMDATATELSIHFADIPIPPTQDAPVRFTFFWTQSGKWQGSDYSVAVISSQDAQ